MSVALKVCGITRPEDAALAVDLGATMLGFILWPRSPRYVEPDQARRIVRGLPAGVTAVGVFVNEPPGTVARIASSIGVGAVQLHGDEDASGYLSIGPRVIKAVPVTAGFEPAAAFAAIPEDVLVLLDAHDPNRRGGTGRTIDWTVAAGAARLRPIVLSGGLTSANVGDAIDRVTPAAVDVSSGVEQSPGIKSPERLRAFVAAIGSRLDSTVPSAARAGTPSNPEPLNRTLNPEP